MGRHNAVSLEKEILNRSSFDPIVDQCETKQSGGDIDVVNDFRAHAGALGAQIGKLPTDHVVPSAVVASGRVHLVVLGTPVTIHSFWFIRVWPFFLLPSYPEGGNFGFGRE